MHNKLLFNCSFLNETLKDRVSRMTCKIFNIFRLISAVIGGVSAIYPFLTSRSEKQKDSLLLIIFRILELTSNGFLEAFLCY